jgi:hypothetical protein
LETKPFDKETCKSKGRGDVQLQTAPFQHLVAVSQNNLQTYGGHVARTVRCMPIIQRSPQAFLAPLQGTPGRHYELENRIAHCIQVLQAERKAIRRCDRNESDAQGHLSLCHVIEKCS